MKPGIVAKFLSLIIITVTVSMVFPLAWAVKDGTDDIRAFLLAGCARTLMAGIP